MSTARVFLETGDHRLVASQRLYHVERCDGEDAMGNKRWSNVDRCSKETPRGDEGDETVTVPAPVFRAMCTKLASLSVST